MQIMKLMKKKITLIISFFVITVNLFAQSAKMKDALKAYDLFHYQAAIEKFQEVLRNESNNEEAIEKLAHSYRKINDSFNAEQFYARVVQNQYVSPQNMLYYAQVLSMNGKYKESKKWYKKYARAVRFDERGHKFSKSYEDTTHFHQDAHRYNVTIAPFNSPQADFSPIFYKEGLIFCSNRENKEANNKLEFKWNNTNFLDLYQVVNNGTPRIFHKKINTEYHEGPTVFHNGYKSMIFTRNNYHQGKFKTSTDDVNKLKMYLASGGDWSNVTEFPYNNDEYSVGHPALTTDETTLYFVSDMPGSMGGTDIFVSTFTNGIWSQPKNLGAPINTKGNEMFPFIDESGNLYFASDGHSGLGGLDIFISHYKNGRYDTPQNMGVPINSSQDDFGLIFDEDRGLGYFSSNRQGGVGDDDIYMFTTKTCDMLVVVVDSMKNEIVTDATLNIKEADNEREILYLTEAPGVYSFRTKFRTSYDLRAFKDGYEEGKKYLGEEDLLDCKSYLEGVTPDTIKIYLNPPGIAKINRNNDTTQKNIPEVPVYITGKYDSTKVEVYDVVTVYYDLDKYYIRPDAANDLNKLLTTLYKYPEMTILLSSHTDSRASYSYNVKLSQRRSRSAYQYLINRGIDPKRVEIDYFGETKLVTPCPDGVPCNENDHQLNRRTEVIVLTPPKNVVRKGK